MNTLSATTRIDCPDGHKLGQQIVQHLAEHGVEVASVSDRIWRLASKHGAAQIIVDRKALEIQGWAPDAEMLMELKYLLASHVGEFNSESSADILWRGDGDELASLPNLRTLTVASIRDLSRHIRRITFQSTGLKRFDTLAALHAKLLLPRGDKALCLPRLTGRGIIDWGADNERAWIRKYTIRSIDAQAGTLDVDFVLHEHGGPGSRFAKEARPGDVIGMIGPGGGSAIPADWNLFVGDETALPAIARLIEALPSNARGVALLEVADTEDEQNICSPAAVEIVWLHRKSSIRNDRLASKATSMAMPQRGSMFAWAGSEFNTFQKVRSDWRQVKRLEKKQHLAVSYWREGQSQT
jgi:NADPH-dependent ferric siderophore reductase